MPKLSTDASSSPAEARPPIDRRGQTLELKAGEWVQVRSEAEILATLDEDGCLDGLPFMPEMLAFCGKRFPVYKSAHKSCDTLQSWKVIRKMERAVHLGNLRCDGAAHGGCQAGCLFYWKEAWLERVPGPFTQEASEDARRAPAPTSVPASNPTVRCDLVTLHASARVPSVEEGQVRYRCQATQMLEATTPARGDLGLYWKDLTSRNVSPREFFGFGLVAALNHLRPFPHIRGTAGKKTPPGEPLGLQPGEWVRVRSKDEILATCNRKLRHRGLSFDVEMLPYCGKTFRVLRRVERLIDERSGRMSTPRNPCIILEDVICSGCRSRNRMFCPRSIYPFWHEVWLERVSGPGLAPREVAEPGA